jgi:hypothetical protein
MKRKRCDDPVYSASNAARAKTWREKNPEKARELQRAYRAKRRAEGKQAASTNQVWRWTLKNKFGLTEDEYNNMVTQQGNKCAICYTTDPCNRGRRWRVDHCHTTNKVRALLCHNCNVTLGLVGEDTDRLRRMIEYIDRTKE